MTHDEWIARFRKRLEERGVDEEMVSACIDGMVGVLACSPDLVNDNPEDAADDEAIALGTDDDD